MSYIIYKSPVKGFGLMDRGVYILDNESLTEIFKKIRELERFKKR